LRSSSAKPGTAAVAAVPDGEAVWALVAIRVPLQADTVATDVEANPKEGGRTGTIGYVYLQTPAKSATILARSRIGSGALVLVLTIPVGALFGLLTTRNLRRWLRRLADASQAVAGGDFTTRLAPASSGELGKLERNFNDMTARLGDATERERERELASLNARLAERSRISRELHDSISQDLFSLALLSGGLQRALPPDSPLQAQMSQIAETVATAIHEMRALVLDIHPSALADKGLGPALEDMCASYHARLGLEIGTTLESVELDAATQHAVLRVAQEALANVVKHADASRITLRLTALSGRAELVVADDGRGFDPSAVVTPSGVGLRLMRERITELGGGLSVDSRPGAGTTLRAVLPATSDAIEPATAGRVL
jgi:signal transduction histidine kinase